MQLTEKSRIEVPNGDSKITYTYDNMETIDDLISFVSFAEKEYGEIEQIKCFIMDEAKDVKLSAIYSNLPDLIKNGKEEILKSRSISFSCKNRYINFTINVNNKTIKISISENSLGSKAYDKSKIKYYNNPYGNIIKYDGNTHLYYFLSPKTNEWVIDQSIMDKFDDAQYFFTPIEYEEDEKKTPHKK